MSYISGEKHRAEIMGISYEPKLAFAARKWDFEERKGH